MVVAEAVAIGIELADTSVASGPPPEKMDEAILVVDPAALAGALLLLAIAYLVPLLVWWRGLGSAWVMLPWLSLPLGLKLATHMRHDRGLALNGSLVRTAHLEVLFGLLFAIGLAW